MKEFSPHDSEVTKIIYLFGKNHLNLLLFNHIKLLSLLLFNHLKLLLLLL